MRLPWFPSAPSGSLFCGSLVGSPAILACRQQLGQKQPSFWHLSHPLFGGLRRHSIDRSASTGVLSALFVEPLARSAAGGAPCCAKDERTRYIQQDRPTKRASSKAHRHRVQSRIVVATHCVKQPDTPPRYQAQELRILKVPTVFDFIFL